MIPSAKTQRNGKKKPDRKKPLVGKLVTSVDELASALGVAVRTLYQYKAKGMPMRKIGGEWNVEACREWLISNNRSGPSREAALRKRQEDAGITDDEVAELDAEITDDDQGGEGETLQRKLMRAQLAKRRLEVELLKVRKELESGKLISVVDVEDNRKKEVLFIRNRLLGFARKLAPRVAGLNAKEAEAMIGGEVRRLLTDMSEGR